VRSSTFDWPFFDDSHRELASSLQTWAESAISQNHAGDTDTTCRNLVKQLGDAGWLRYGVPKAFGGMHDRLDVRSLCIARETLARVSGLADFSFAMQGLGAGPISLFGSDALKKKYLPRVATGDAISAFAISEADAGSDVAAMTTTARLDGNDYVINGSKTWISNGGIADQYVVFCRLHGTDREFVALVVEPGDPGFSVGDRIDTIAPHPLATINFDNCRVPSNRVVGEKNKGLSIALGTLDVFRSTVGAAALGFARRALDESLAFVSTRPMFGEMLKDFQLTQARLATMATDIDASALLIYRAAWTKDTLEGRITREAAMAKMYATEAAQRVIDSAVQLLGGRGVVSGNPVEKLYREIRALRIYEGTSEVQQLIIGRHVLEEFSKSVNSNA
jgi:Acyl-CoA dehydrogenases